MRVKLSSLRRIIREIISEETYASIRDDESYKKNSLIVPDDIKDKIDSYFDDMRL